MVVDEDDGVLMLGRRGGVGDSGLDDDGAAVARGLLLLLLIGARFAVGSGAAGRSAIVAFAAVIGGLVGVAT